MDLRLKTLKNLFKKNINNKTIYLIFFLGFFFSTLLATNNKSFLLLFFIFYVLCFFFFKRNIFESTFLTLLVSLPFENSIREWSFYTSSSNNSDGYSFFFGITVKMALCLVSLLILLLPKYKFLLDNKKSKVSILLLVFYFLASITSIFFQERLVFVFIGLIRLSLSVWLYFLASVYFSQKNKNYIFKYFITSLIIFSSFIGLLQFVKQKPIGKFVELTPGFSIENGYSTTDGEKQYRVSGFMSHPVYFGSFMSMLIPIFMGIILQKSNSKKKKTHEIITYLGLITLSIVVLLGVLSRSTWLNLFLMVILFYFYIKRNRLVIIPIKLSTNIKKIIFFIIFLIFLFPAISVVTTRVKSIPDLFTNKDGSAVVRLSLAQMSVKLALFRPLTGVGLNNFTFENYDQSTSSFAAPPHNTILIFLSELGIPTTALFVFFVILSLLPKINILKSKPIFFGVWVGLLTFIISSQFHPLFNLDSTFDIFMFTLGYFSTCQQSIT